MFVSNTEHADPDVTLRTDKHDVIPTTVGNFLEGNPKNDKGLEMAQRGDSGRERDVAMQIILYCQSNNKEAVNNQTK